MPKIPTYTSQAQRTGRTGLAPIDPRNPVTTATGEAAGQIAQIGAQMHERMRQLRQTQKTLEANTSIMKSLADTEFELLNSETWNTDPMGAVEQFEQSAEDIKDEHLKNIDDLEVRNAVAGQYSQSFLSRYTSLQQKARKKQVDLSIGTLNSTLQELSNQALEADDAELPNILQQGQGAVESMAEAGVIPNEKKSEILQEWQSDVSANTVRQDMRADPLGTLKDLRSGEYDYLPESARGDLLEEAEEVALGAAYDQAIQFNDRDDARDYLHNSGLSGPQLWQAKSRVSTHFNQVEKAAEQDRKEQTENNDMEVLQGVMNNTMGEQELEQYANERSISESTYKWAKKRLNEPGAEEDDPILLAEINEDVNYNNFEDARSKLHYGLENNQITGDTFADLIGNLSNDEFANASKYVSQALSPSQADKWTYGKYVRVSEAHNRFRTLVRRGTKPMQAAQQTVEEYMHSQTRDLSTMRRPKYLRGKTSLANENLIDNLRDARDETTRKLKAGSISQDEFKEEIDLINSWMEQVQEYQQQMQGADDAIRERAKQASE